MFYAGVGDLEDLLRAKDYQFRQDSLARQALGTAPDPNWDRDFAERFGAYTIVHGKAQAFIASTPSFLRAVAPAGDMYDAVLRSIRQNWNGTTGGMLLSNDLAALEQRLMRAGGKPDYSQMPQPDPANDLSLRIFQMADKATRAIEKAGQFSLGVGVLALLAFVLISNKSAR